MPNRSQTIEIFLPDGEPRGLRLAGITTRIVQAIQRPRSKLDRLFERPETQRVSLYFLFGPNDDVTKTSVYIGQTEDLKNRLRTHHSAKDFWTSVIAVTSRTDSFTQVHVKYLEWLSIDRAQQAQRYDVINGNAGGKPYIPEPLEADVLDAFETASTLVATLGEPLFTPLANRNKEQNDNEFFYVSGRQSEGRGYLDDDGFLVLAGSLCRREHTPAFKTSNSSIPRLIPELLESKVLSIHSDEQFVLDRDYLANSPSQAAALVLGRPSSGWQEWKNKAGQTLDEVYRQPVNENTGEA